MEKHLKVKITGRVQGVWYRGSTQRQAEELGLKGFVRNEPDGSVYMEAEGREAALQLLVGWCRQGPPRARVDTVQWEEGEWKGFDHFTIKR